MTNLQTFNLLKNGNVSTTVWANLTTKEIYSANKNPYGFNAQMILGDWFYNKYGNKIKHNQGRADYTKFFYSEKSMNEVGFQLVLRGSKPLF